MRLFILIFMLLSLPAFGAQEVEKPAFDVQAALREGYSKAEIADYLADNSKFDIGAARKEGYSDDEILEHLVNSPGTPLLKVRPDLSKVPKWRDIAAKPEFLALSPEKQAEAKAAYFDHWIAPHAAADGMNVAEVRAEFLRQISSPASPLPAPANAAKGTHVDYAQSPTAGSVTLYATLLQVVAFGIAWAIGFLLNRPALKLWRQVAGFLAGLAIGGPAVIAAWAFAMDALMPDIPGAFKQLIPTMMGKAIWSAVLGAGLGVYFGRQKARSKATASTDAHSTLATPAQFLARLSTMKLPAINLERALLGIIAASTLAIAAKLWLAPAPVSYADFDALAKMEERGADPKALDEKREELRRRVPWVRIVGQ